MYDCTFITVKYYIKMKTVFTLLIIACLLAGCVINKITGRNQLSLVSESELQLMATSQYNTFLTENKVLNPGSSKDAAMVDRIGLTNNKCNYKVF